MTASKHPSSGSASPPRASLGRGSPRHLLPQGAKVSAFAARALTLSPCGRGCRAAARSEAGEGGTAKLLPCELHGADRHRHGGLGRIDDRNFERSFERAAVARHAGTAEDDRVGAVAVAEFAGDLDP